jgi:hypothetical protein
MVALVTITAPITMTDAIEVTPPSEVPSTPSPTGLFQYIAAPPLGSCERFSLHGHAGVTATGDIAIYGDVRGDNALTGFGTSPLPHVHTNKGYAYYIAGSSEANKCAADKQIAYNAAEAATSTNTAPTNLGALTLTLTQGIHSQHRLLQDCPHSLDQQSLSPHNQISIRGGAKREVEICQL